MEILRAFDMLMSFLAPDNIHGRHEHPRTAKGALWAPSFVAGTGLEPAIRLRRIMSPTKKVYERFLSHPFTLFYKFDDMVQRIQFISHIHVR
jgi:hypothetical protein